MIEFTKSYKTSDGEMFASIEDAQTHELAMLLRRVEPSTENNEDAKEASCDMAAYIIAHAEQVIDILTTTPKSKPKARAINGGKKPRKAKVPMPMPEPEPVEEERPHVRVGKIQDTKP